MCVTANASELFCVALLENIEGKVIFAAKWKYNVVVKHIIELKKHYEKNKFNCSLNLYKIIFITLFIIL